MARPHKEGLEYFPLVTNFEDKIDLLTAEFGARAVGIIVSLYQKIYSSGYFIKWDYDALMLFARQVNEEITKVEEVINRCFDREVFEKKLHKKYSILTSHGIQKQFLKICKETRRKKVHFIKDYCLVCDNELLKVITELTTVNAGKTGEKPVISTQIEIEKEKEITEFILAAKLRDLILQNNPKAKVPDDLEKWANDIDLMIRIDKRTEEEIDAVIKFSQLDNFWKTNILSAGKLRKQFDQLYLQMQQKSKRGNQAPEVRLHR